MESIVFHARKKPEDKDPTFTARFGMEPNLGDKPTLLCVVSKPHPHCESYCKETGRIVTEGRLNKFREETEHISDDKIIVFRNVTSIKDLKKYLPSGTAGVLHHYANKAKRYFKVDDPRIVIKGTEIDWRPKKVGALAVKSPRILITSIDAITPKEKEKK